MPWRASLPAPRLPACAKASCLCQGFGRQAADRRQTGGRHPRTMKMVSPSPLRGEGGGEGESKPLPPHLNPLPPEGRGGILDSYMFNSENLSLTIMSPLTPPSPQWGEGKGEGKFQISLASNYWIPVSTPAYRNACTSACRHGNDAPTTLDSRSPIRSGTSFTGMTKRGDFDFLRMHHLFFRFVSRFHASSKFLSL